MKEPYDFEDVLSGELVTLHLSFDDLMDRLDVMRCLTHKGRTLRKITYHTPKQRAQKRKQTPFSKAYNKPLKSRSAGCHTSQAAEFNEAARKAGLTGVYYDPKDGNAYFSSRQQRRMEVNRRGLKDLDGGYGDG